MRIYRGMFKSVSIVEGCMGTGYVIVEKDNVLGDCPIASVNIPLASKEKSKALADFIAASINNELVSHIPNNKYECDTHSRGWFLKGIYTRQHFSYYVCHF